MNRHLHVRLCVCVCVCVCVHADIMTIGEWLFDCLDLPPFEEISLVYTYRDDFLIDQLSKK